MLTETQTILTDNSGFQHRSTNDASQHAQAQEWLQVEYSQIDAGEFEGQISQRDYGPVSIFLEHQSKAVHKRAEMPSNRCTVSMVNQGHDSARFMRHSMEHNDSLFLVSASTDCDLVIPAGVSTCYAVMDDSELLAGIRTLSADGWERGMSGLHMYRSASSHHLLEQLLRIGLTQNNLAGKTNEECNKFGRKLLHQLALIIHHSTATYVSADSRQCLRQRRLKVVRKTRDYILSCLDSHYSPSVVDICKDVGVGARILQYSFQEFMQITPVAYLRILRLHKVRQQLLMPSNNHCTVTDIAIRFGFLHLSKFAQDYATLFGELPSLTLQRGLR